MNTVLEQAKAIQSEIVEIRRDIHRHPELGGKEVRTSALIRQKLGEYGVDSIESPTPTSVVALIKGTKGEGKTIAMRADMDALPVDEATGYEFASENPGIMHACGHDMHVSMMLGNAKLLCDNRDKFAGTAKLIFQHSEEDFPGGSRALVDAGVMEGVDAIIGMHVFPTENEQAGRIGTKVGPFTTSADEYWFDIIGKGGHGSQPHKVPDPILASAEMIMMFQQVQAREINPLDFAVFMMNKIEGGVAPNIISSSVRMGGNARAYTPEARDKITDNVYRIAQAVEVISGCKINVEAKFGYDSCCNDEDLTNFVQAAMTETIGEDRVITYKEPMGFSEDFSFYSTKTGVPSVLLILEAGNNGEVAPLHNAHCTFNEEAIPYGMAGMTGAAIKFLQQ